MANKRPHEDSHAIQRIRHSTQAPRLEVRNDVQHSQQLRLCARCAQIDFGAVLAGNGEHQAHLLKFSLRSARAEKQCPCCIFISRCAADILRDRQVTDVHADFDCDIGPNSVAIDTFKVNGVSEPGYSVCLALVLKGDVSGEPLSDDDFDDHSDNFHMSFDVLNANNSAKDHERRLVATRRQVPKFFDITRLRTWLDRDDSYEIADPPSIGYSLKSLIAASRFRVIDVRSHKVLTIDHPVRYLALSYVWGQSSVNRKKPCQSTLSQIDQTLEIDALPLTFRDAINLVRLLGERYIWIDAICIHDEPQDTSVIIPCMGAIYSAAYLTIIVATGENADAGLGRLSGSPNDIDFMTVVDNSFGRFTLTSHRSSLAYILGHTAWNSRAWTFQELLLAKRCVIATEEEIFFISRHLDIREAYQLHFDASEYSLRGQFAPEDGSGVIELDGLGVPSLMDFGICRESFFSDISLENLIHPYSNRKSTYVGDRLNAFIGLYDLVESELVSTKARIALSGLLQDNMSQGLAWEYLGHELAGDNGHARIHHDHGYTRHLPSWSWAGWTGETWCARYKLTRRRSEIVDEANIKCNLIGVAPTVEPALCEIEPVLKVTLHLWTWSIRCALGEPFDDELGYGDSAYGRLFIAKPSTEHVFVDLTTVLGDNCTIFTSGFFGVQYDLPHYLIPLCGTEEHTLHVFLVVEQHSAFFERVGCFQVRGGKDDYLRPQGVRNVLLKWESLPQWISMR